jgi:hypothetical protein
MKESLLKIQAWIKAHPWPAAGIALILIIAAYFAIKKGGGMGATGYTQNGGQGADATSGDSSGLSALGSSGASMPGVSNNTPAFSDSGGGFSPIPSLPVFSPSDMSASFAPSGYMDTSTAPVYAGSTDSMVNNPLGSVSAGLPSALSRTAGVINRPIETLPALGNTPVAALANKTGVSGGISAAKTISRPVATSAPAQKSLANKSGAMGVTKLKSGKTLLTSPVVSPMILAATQSAISTQPSVMHAQ